MQRKYTRSTITDHTYGYEGGGASATLVIHEVNVGISEHTPGQRADMCDICGETFRVGKIRVFRGRNYGIPCGCSADIRSILAQEAAKRYNPKRGPEPSGELIYE